MRKCTITFISLFILISFLGCEAINNDPNKEGSNNKGDWPVYNFEEMFEEVDLIAFVTVESNQDKKLTGKKNEGSIDAKISKLTIDDIAYSKNENIEETIELDQSENFVEPGRSYLMFLSKDKNYYNLVDGNSVIPEKENIYEVKVSGIEGKSDKNQLLNKIKKKIE